MLEDIEPRDDIQLAPGDVLVLLGFPESIKLFETYALTGK